MTQLDGDRLPQILTALEQQLAHQNDLLERIALALEQSEFALPGGSAPGSSSGPNYEVCLSQFKTFDWASIDATVEYADSDGVATVIWRGHRYVRRSAENKFKPAIWFSRSTGRDDEGNVRYAKLATFSLRPKAEPLPSKVKDMQAS